MQLTRDGPQPLFRQIEARLRYEIITGRRSSGSRLPSLRDAAWEWGVNLHTVRRAYGELAATGLVRTSGGGTRVAALGPSADEATSLELRVRQFADEARATFGASARALARAFEALEQPDRKPPRSCTVVECSRALGEGLARDLRGRFVVETHALDLLAVSELPAGTIVGTYFHADRLQELMAGRLSELSLIRIRPRLVWLGALARAVGAGELRHVVLIDRLPRSAHDLSDELQSYLGPEVTIEVRILRDPLAAFPELAPGTIVVATPQTWDRLPADLRDRVDVRPLVYEIEPADMERLGDALGWEPRRRVRAL